MSWLGALCTLFLAGCSTLVPSQPAPVVNLVMVNNTDAAASWAIEQPTGEMVRFEVQPCTSTSVEIDAGRAWEVEWGATFAVTSEDVSLLDAPVTLVQVRFNPEGTVDVVPPRSAAHVLDAPYDSLTCADR